jgi:hypothetical protein
MNTPVTTAEMERFKSSNEQSIGGKELIGVDEKGKPFYAPNRKERRARLNAPKGNNRKVTKGRRKITLFNKREEGEKLTVKTAYNTHL